MISNNMCDLFGMSCNHEDRATSSLERFATRSRDNSNNDGWGIAFFDEGHAIVERASDDEVEIPAVENEKFFDVVRKAKSKNIIAHTRHSTCGSHCELDCHPFKTECFGREWIFAHNGYINSWDDSQRHENAQGHTDSESLFLEIMGYAKNYMSENGKIHGLYPAIKHALKKILEKYSLKLNFLLTDGDMYYTFNHYPDKPMYMLRRMKGYGPVLLLSTQKLDLRDDYKWEKLPSDQLLVLNCGEIIVLSDKLN